MWERKNCTHSNYRIPTSLDLCEGHFYGDGDVDGSYWAELAVNPDLLDLSIFVIEYGANQSVTGG